MSKQDLVNQVNSIIETLENPKPFCPECDCEYNHDDETCLDCECDLQSLTGYEYLLDVLDINWILNSDRTIKGARILVCFGGPNVWIDTTTNTVDGYWWGDQYSAQYQDNIDLDSAVEELFSC